LKTFEYEDTIGQEFERLLTEKRGRCTAFSIGVQSHYRNATNFYLTPHRSGESVAYFGAVVRNVETAVQLAQIADKFVDYIFVDSEKKIAPKDYGENDVGNVEKAVSEQLRNAKLLTYKGNDLTAHSFDATLRALAPNLTGAKISVVGIGNLGAKISLSLVERGNNVCLFTADVQRANSIAKYINEVKPKNTIGICSFAERIEEAISGTNILVASSDKKGKISTSMVQSMEPLPAFDRPLLFDVGKGCFDAEMSSLDKFPIFRIDVENFLTSEFENLIRLLQLSNIQERFEIDPELRLVRQGVVGRTGEILVDNPQTPTKIIGVCDGEGNLIPYKSMLSDDQISKILGRIF